MFTDSTITPYTRDLGSNLILKSISTRDEIERLAAFNETIHGQSLDTMTRHLILHHPDTRPEHWLFVEDTTTGQIVSSLCLIPWTWRYDGVALRAGEMGIVGTLEDYRHRGLIRALVERFKELLDAGEYDLSQIQGIPYYYRQFGYEYAIPLEGGWHLAPYQIPDSDEPPAFEFRRATLADIPVLMQFYDEAAQDLALSSVRSEGVWHYLLEHSPATETASEYWLVLDGAGQPVGYWCIQLYGFGTSLNIPEASRLSHPAALAVLRFLKSLAAERDKPYIRLFMQPGSTLIHAARAWGAQDRGQYAWQIHLPNVGRLLQKLVPVLERRIAASPLAGLTETVTINLYREAFDLRFEGGQLVEVAGVGFKDGGPICIPPLVFTTLVLGYRCRAELKATYPDVSIWGQSEYLVDVLFPKAESYIYTHY